MLYQPTFPSPYLETIDLGNSTGNVFKCLINPKNKVTGYKINVLLNSDNNSCCQLKGWLEDVDGVQTQKKAYSIDEGATWTEFDSIPNEDSVLPVVGNFSDESWLQILIPSDVDLGLTNENDYKWNITLYQDSKDIKVLTGTFYAASSSTTQTVFKIERTEKIIAKEMYIKTNNVLRKITAVDNSTSENYTKITLESELGFKVGTNTSYEILSTCITSYDYYFKSRKTPVLTFEVPDTINSLSHTFSASITRESEFYGANISSYKFNLYLGTELIYTSENVYSNDITYTYNGFISGNKYSIRLTVITEDGETINDEKEFLVSYNISYSTILVEAEIDKAVNGVSLDYSSQVSINGLIKDSSDVSYTMYKNSNDNIPETNNSVYLEKGQILYWDSVNNTKDLIIPNNSTTLLHWHGDLGYTGKIAELSSNLLTTEKISIGYDSKNFYYKIGTNDAIYYNPYTNGSASVIAGADDYSVGGQILEYTNENNVVQITIPYSEKVHKGMYVFMSGERKLITDVINQNDTETVITIESAFASEITEGQSFFIYDELRCYTFSDDDIPQDTDIFVENDIGHNYWWLIVIKQNEVRFIKTKRYTDTVVSE